MAFDANRDIKIEASQSANATFALRTKGLATRKRAELEIVGVPEPALHAAAGILNEVADYSVKRAEVLAGQDVGFTLSVEEGPEPLMLAVHAAEAAPPSGGLWTKLTGGGKGVLRLVDVGGAKSDAPLTALATMLVHRAAVRAAKEDRDGAREELQSAIATFPGSPAEAAGDAPTVGEGGAAYNWQNHRAYLALAELEGLEGGPPLFAEALRRSRELSRVELGATLDELAAVDEATARAEASRVLDVNFDTFAKAEGPTPEQVIVPSPLWETEVTRGGGARALRRASLVPAKLVELYYVGKAAKGVREHGASLASTAFAASRKARWTLAWRLRAHRDVWGGAGPVASTHAHHPAAGLLSLILVDVARCFRAGASVDEIAMHLSGHPPDTLVTKLSTLEEWVAEQYMAALST